MVVGSCAELLSSLRFAEAIAGGICRIAAPISIITDLCCSFQHTLQQISANPEGLVLLCTAPPLMLLPHPHMWKHVFFSVVMVGKGSPQPNRGVSPSVSLQPFQGGTRGTVMSPLGCGCTEPGLIPSLHHSDCCCEQNKDISES